MGGSAVIADGYGLIYRGGGESIGEINLIGAVISGTLYGDTTLTSIKINKIIMPGSVKLYPNYPNPFNPSTTISYSIPNAGFVTLKVYDILGSEVASLVNGYRQQGKYSVNFNASNLASGVYFYKLNTGSYTSIKKMLLLK